MLSWFPVPKDHPIIRILYSIIQPLIRIVRFLPHRIGVLDLSPFIIFLALNILTSFLVSFRDSLFSGY
ncbi:YggT family protein [Candidatus Peregrinibacteria bacterium]|nr:MAG: YggT family protein [Candidatus Peregrinibacteria bacterium]